MESNVALSSNSAGFWIRLVGYLIDSVVIIVPAIVISAVLGWPTALDVLQNTSPQLLPGTFKTGALTVILGILYHGIMESSKWQASIGKRVFGMTVSTMDGDRIGFIRASIRYLLKFLMIGLFPLILVVVGLNERKRGIHDFIADTRVYI